MPETVIVTGGAGFIGSHVVDLLVARGHAVHVVDNLSTGKRSNLHRSAKLHSVDIRSAKLGPLFKKIRASSVIHLAAHIDLRKSVHEPAGDADINIMGGLNVLTAALHSGVRHFVFASTAAVYSGAKTIPTPEDAPKTPLSPYGAAKFAFENYLHVFHHIHGMHNATLRFANVYGPRQTPKGEAGAVAIFMKLLRAKKPVTINGDGMQTRDFVFVTDVARMVVAAMEQYVHGVFNVSTGKETSINELYEKIRRLVGSKAKAEHGPEKPNDDARCALDPAKAAATLGWSGEMPLDDGLLRTWEWIQTQKK